MKKLEDFVVDINEHRGRPRKATEEQKTEQAENPRQLEDVKGLDEEDNESFYWSIDPPTEDDVTKGIDKDELNKNAKRILFRLKSNKPFFTQGEAGWGKTSIIKKLAKKCGRTIVTVYLDKAEATDLGGIPAPKKAKGGVDRQTHLMPEWAAIMWENPKTQFLLFFDELNQATPDITSALMPIVLEHEICGRKFKNFIVGAAGNFDYENPDAIYELGKPLLSRFGGIIKWISGDWNSAFKYLHKKWDDKMSYEFLENVHKYVSLFKNPRDVESFIIETVFNLRESKDYEYFDVEDFKDQLMQIAKEKLSRPEEVDLESLAELCYDYLHNAEKKDGGTRKAEANQDLSMIPENVRNAVKSAMEKGFIRANGVNYGISRENIYKVTNPKVCNAEMLERLINKYEIDGVKFRYETNDQWKKDGYKETQDFIINADYKPEDDEKPKAKKSHLND